MLAKLAKLEKKARTKLAKLVKLAKIARTELLKLPKLAKLAKTVRTKLAKLAKLAKIVRPKLHLFYVFMLFYLKVEICQVFIVVYNIMLLALRLNLPKLSELQKLNFNFSLPNFQLKIFSRTMCKKKIKFKFCINTYFV